jgi:ribosome recycling factor
MTVLADVLTQAETRMKKAIVSTQEEMATLRTGRANPGVLDRLLVDYYGVPTPVRQMAGVSVSEGTTLVIQPFDKSTLGDIDKAIAKSDLGLNPSNDGQVIRIAIPPLSQERRKEICKTVHKMGEEGKVAIRNIRRDAMDTLSKHKKDAGISEDEIKTEQERLQKKTDHYIKEVEALVVAKEQEVMQV